MATVISSLALRLGFDRVAFQQSLTETAAMLSMWSNDSIQSINEVGEAVDGVRTQFGGLADTVSELAQPARRLFPTSIISQDDIEQVRAFDGAMQSLADTIRETRAQGALLGMDVLENIVGPLSETALQPTTAGRVTRAVVGARQAAEERGGFPMLPTSGQGFRTVLGIARDMAIQQAGEFRLSGRDAEQRQRLADQQISRRGRFDPVQYRRELRMMQLRTRGVRIIAR